MNIVWRIYDSRRGEAILSILIAIVAGVAFGVSVVISPLIVPVLAVGVFTAYVLFVYPIVNLYLLIIVIIFTSAMPRGSIIPFLAPNELMLIGSVGIVALLFVKKRDERSLPGAIMLAGAILFVTTGVIPLLAFSIRGISFTFSEVFKFGAPLQNLLVFWLFANVPRSDVDRERIIQLLLLGASFAAAVALLQIAGVQPVITFLQKWYPTELTEASVEARRATSVFGAWNTLGTFLMLNLMLLIALQSHNFPPLYVFNMVVAAILSLFGLLASGSYASILGLVFSFVIIKTIDRRGLRAYLPMFFVIGIGVIILFPVISNRFAYQFEGTQSGILPNTFAYRLKVWREIYIPLILRDPIWGVSPTLENLGFEYAESEYLLLMFRSGLVALLGFLTWLGMTLLWLLTIIRGVDNKIRSMALALFILLLTLAVMGFTNPVFTYSGVIDYVWIMLGLIASKQEGRIHVAD